MDLLFEIDHNHRLSIKLYDKRDDFDFPIVNFPFICSNIPQSPAYGVFISQLIRYARACSSYEDFLYRGRMLASKLCAQGFIVVKLKSAIKKFFGRYHELVDKYGLSVSALEKDLLS